MNNVVSIRFGDLISELSKNCENIEYNIITTMGDNGSKSLGEVLNKYKVDSNYQRMIVTIKGDNKFKYRFFVPFNIFDTDAIGLKLYNHLDVNVANNGKKKSIYSTVVVPYAVDDVILNIDDTVMNRCEDINFYPVDIFRNIVKNNDYNVKKRIRRK